jgi:hypothetical protein
MKKYEYKVEVIMYQAEDNPADIAQKMQAQMFEKAKLGLRVLSVSHDTSRFGYTDVRGVYSEYDRAVYVTYEGTIE